VRRRTLATVTKDEMLDAIVLHRGLLIDRLGELNPDGWDTPSLCAGWKVRDVVGHLVSILDIPMSKFVGSAVLARSFDKVADRFAREYGSRDPKALLDSYRSVANKRFAPPGVGPIAPLTDLLVHSRDIERPLGLSANIQEPSMHMVLNYVCGGKARGFVPAKRTNGLRFVATDTDWSIGSGPLVTGPADAIMSAATNRRAALSDLSGDGAAIFAQRLT
jgi:uncharacterized protein (TIGR03083 family)